MKRNSLGPVDIAGITLGGVAIALVIVSIVVLTTSRPLGAGWPRGPRAWAQEFERGGPWQKTEEDQTVSGSFREVEIRGVAGSIAVVGGGEGGVQVHSVKSAFSPRAMEDLKVGIEKEGDRLVVSEKRERAFMRGGSIDFTVTVPKGVQTLTAHTVSGSVSVRGLGPGVAQRLETVSGSVTTDRSGDLHASTTSGRVEFHFAGRDLEARSISGSVDGTIDAIERGGSVRISTISGSVSVAAFAALDARLNLHSLSGSVSCGFPVTAATKKNNALEGSVGAGSVPVEISTTSGSISLDRK
jgi:hypothetical protein